jgi:hypothetical protein
VQLQAINYTVLFAGSSNSNSIVCCLLISGKRCSAKGDEVEAPATLYIAKGNAIPLAAESFTQDGNTQALPYSKAALYFSLPTPSLYGNKNVLYYYQQINHRNLQQLLLVVFFF